MLDRYDSPMQQCQRHRACDALVLGSLIQKLKQGGLFPVPPPDAPTMSAKELFSFLRSLDIPSFCELTGNHSKQQPCGVNNKLSDVAWLRDPIHGLDLTSFLSATPPGSPWLHLTREKLVPIGVTKVMSLATYREQQWNISTIIYCLSVIESHVAGS